jgi:hypothetical protein
VSSAVCLGATATRRLTAALDAVLLDINLDAK